MGSLTSKPKVPSRVSTPTQQVVYVPQPVSTPVFAQTSVQIETPAPEQVAAEARKSSLLTRDRGRFGTILTSFRGFLGERDVTPKRKTLLGE